MHTCPGLAGLPLGPDGPQLPCGARRTRRCSLRAIKAQHLRPVTEAADVRSSCSPTGYEGVKSRLPSGGTKCCTLFKTDSRSPQETRSPRGLGPGQHAEARGALPCQGRGALALCGRPAPVPAAALHSSVADSLPGLAAGPVGNVCDAVRARPLAGWWPASSCVAASLGLLAVLLGLTCLRSGGRQGGSLWREARTWQGSSVLPRWTRHVSAHVLCCPRHRAELLGPRHPGPRAPVGLRQRHD